MGLKTCDVCGEELFKEVVIFGQKKVFRRACACRRKELEEEERLAEESRLFNRAKDILELGYLDKSYANYTFASTDDKESKEYHDLRQYCVNWEKAKKVNRGIYLYGNVGTGKTFYASSIANEIRKTYGDYVLIGRASEMIRYFTRDYGRNEDAEYQIKTYPLLVIDDIGAERESNNGLSVMNEIIDMRYTAKKPLIVTSNYEIDKLYEGLGMLGDRIKSRLNGICVPYKITGKDRRDNG